MINDEDERFNSELDEWRKLPVFKQALVILHLIEHIIEGIHLDDPHPSTHYKLRLYERYTRQMMENALLIPSEIATADSTDLYDHKMENATIIRKAAKEIIADSKGLQASGYKEVEYLELLYDAVEEFRPLFAEWVQSFNTKNFIIDRWGLFNPPGVSYNDSVDTISFDSKSFLRDLEDDWDDNDDDDLI